MPKLRVSRGRTTAEEFRFADEILIGRAEECGVRVFDEGASRRHTAVRREKDTCFAVDLGSLNGTFVNGRRIERRELHSGDEIEVCGLVLVFLADKAHQRTTVLKQRGIDIRSRIEPSGARVRGAEEELLGRLAAVYRFHAVLALPVRRMKRAIVEALEETFSPARAALLLPGGDLGTYSRSVAEHVRRKREAILVRDPEVELPRASSLITKRVKSAMAAPLGRFGALYVDRSEGKGFTPHDLELLTALANAATPVLRPEPSVPPPCVQASDLLGESPAMRSLRLEIARIAPTGATVLIEGETGTGKELVARALHAQSPRAGRPFVAVNCAALVETLLEAELFGHEKGAFTGADRAHPGRFEQAHGGTLFLDEVGELAPGLQAKLLRVLEQREFFRIGATRPTRVDVRVVSATNRDLKAGGFREDLYYRLGVVTLTCPPLRERPGDAELLARRFSRGKSFSPAALERIAAYRWPGNVRELKNVCERCGLLCPKDVVEVEDLPLEVRLGKGEEAAAEGGIKTLREMEREMVARALEATGGNRTRAAKLLGISYPTLKKRIDEFGL